MSKYDGTIPWAPLVSIVIPVFNGANYLKESIESALNQTYQNIEIIVINDGSTDDGLTDKIAREYSDKIRYFSKENGGCASALNFGISKMTGEYFSWLSHDDLYNSEKIENQISFLRNYKNKNTILYSGYDVINQNGSYIYSVKPSFILNKEQLNISLAPLMRGLINGCTLLIPQNLFKQYGRFDETLLCTQDYHLWFNMFRSNSVQFNSGQGVKARVHQGQSTNLDKDLVLKEGNALWVGFLDRVTNEEMIQIDGSIDHFLLKTSEFLRGSPYLEAAKYAEILRGEYIETHGIIVDKNKFDFGKIVSIFSTYGGIKSSLTWFFWLIKHDGVHKAFKKILYALRR